MLALWIGGVSGAVVLWGVSGYLVYRAVRNALAGDDRSWFAAGMFCVPCWALGIVVWRGVGEIVKRWG